MSNPNFVSDLVAMAKAFEELPKVQEQYLQANARWLEGQSVIQRLEQRIMDLKAESDAKSESIRKVEAERDDAEYRFLESEDRTKQALNFIRSTFGSAGSLIQALEPPAPASVPVPPAEAEVKHEAPWTAEQALADPAKRHDMFPEDVYYQPAPEAPMYATEPAQPAPTGQSEPLPTGAETSVSSNVEVTTSDADPTNSALVDTTHSSVDPIAANVSMADDVGYHNEPNAGTDFQAWNAWADRMTARYGNKWPDATDLPEPKQTEEDRYSF